MLLLSSIVREGRGADGERLLFGCLASIIEE